jgi:tetratricopeptide (TPR) repeat protein
LANKIRGNKMNARELYDRGIDERNGNNNSAAIDCFTKALKKNKDERARYLYELANTQLKQNNKSLAVSTFEKASKEFTNSHDKAKCHLEIGRIYVSQHCGSSAKIELEKAIELFTNDTDKAHCEFALGLAYREQYDYKSAIKALERSLLLLPLEYSWKFKCYFEIGLIYRQKAALTRGEELVSIFYPGYTDKKNLGIAIYYYDKALSCFEQDQYFHYIQEKASLLIYRAEAYQLLQDYQNAHADYTNAYTFCPRLAETTTNFNLKNFVTKFPDFYEKTLKPLLSSEQLEYAETIKIEHNNRKIAEEKRQEKFHAFKSKLTLYQPKKSNPEDYMPLANNPTTAVASVSSRAKDSPMS